MRLAVTSASLFLTLTFADRASAQEGGGWFTPEAPPPSAAPPSAAPPSAAPPSAPPYPAPTAPPGSPPAAMPPAMQPGPPAAPPRARLERPTDVQGYARLRRQLRIDLKTAERNDATWEAERLRGEIDTVDDWFRADVERESTGAFVSGIVMLSVGGAAVLTGAGLEIAAAATSSSDDSFSDALQLGGDITLLSGAVLLGVGIPLAVWGGGRVMVNGASATLPARRPDVGLEATPSGARLVGSF